MTVDFVIYFMIYSLFGWMTETVFATINERRLINRGFLAGPICPIYGFSSILIIMCFYIINNNIKDQMYALIAVVVTSIVVVTIVEYITGYLLERIFNCKCWDYSNNMLNLNGYICLKYSILWGVLTLILIRVIHPYVYEYVNSIPYTVKFYVADFFMFYFMLDTIISVSDAVNLKNLLLNNNNLSFIKFYDKLMNYKRLLLAFPRLLNFVKETINIDLRGKLYDKVDKIKISFKGKSNQ